MNSTRVWCFEAPSIDFAAGHRQCGERAGGAVARIVVSHTSVQSGPHRQRRWRAINRLNLRLFIHVEHQGGRVEVEPDDVGQLAVELGGAADLEALQPVRLQPVLLPDAIDRVRLQPDLLGQPQRVPIDRRLGPTQCCADSRLFTGPADPPRAPHTRLGAQSDKPIAAVPPPPQTDGSLTYFKPGRQAVDTLAQRYPTLFALLSPKLEICYAHATTAPMQVICSAILHFSTASRPC